MPQLTDDDITRLTTKADGLRAKIKELEADTFQNAQLDAQNKADKVEDSRAKMIKTRKKQLADIEALLPKAATAK